MKKLILIIYLISSLREIGLGIWFGSYNKKLKGLKISELIGAFIWLSLKPNQTTKLNGSEKKFKNRIYGNKK